VVSNVHLYLVASVRSATTTSSRQVQKMRAPVLKCYQIQGALPPSPDPHWGSVPWTLAGGSTPIAAHPSAPQPQTTWKNLESSRNFRSLERSFPGIFAPIRTKVGRRKKTTPSRFKEKMVKADYHLNDKLTYQLQRNYKPNRHENRKCVAWNSQT